MPVLAWLAQTSTVIPDPAKVLADASDKGIVYLLCTILGMTFGALVALFLLQRRDNKEREKEVAALHVAQIEWLKEQLRLSAERAKAIADAAAEAARGEMVLAKALEHLDADVAACLFKKMPQLGPLVERLVAQELHLVESEPKKGGGS